MSHWNGSLASWSLYCSCGYLSPHSMLRSPSLELRKTFLCLHRPHNGSGRLTYSEAELCLGVGGEPLEISAQWGTGPLEQAPSEAGCVSPMDTGTISGHCTFDRRNYSETKDSLEPWSPRSAEWFENWAEDLSANPKNSDKPGMVVHVCSSSTSRQDGRKRQGRPRGS